MTGRIDFDQEDRREIVYAISKYFWRHLIPTVERKKEEEEEEEEEEE